MFDCIIIGGGPAGLCAALYGARAGLDVVVMEKLFTGGQAATTYEVDNYLGFDEGIEGPDLTMKMENHVRRAGAKIFYENVLDLDLSSSVKKVKTDKATHEAKTVILATGASPRLLGLENEDRLRGMGGFLLRHLATGRFSREKWWRFAAAATWPARTRYFWRARRKRCISSTGATSSGRLSRFRTR